MTTERGWCKSSISMTQILYKKNKPEDDFNLKRRVKLGVSI